MLGIISEIAQFSFMICHIDILTGIGRIVFHQNLQNSHNPPTLEMQWSEFSNVNHGSESNSVSYSDFS